MSAWWLILAIGWVGCSAASSRPLAPSTPTRVLCPEADERQLCVPVQRLDPLLASSDLQIVDSRPIPTGGSGAMLVVARLGEEGPTVRLKWKAGRRGGHGVNRSPRHELAAYALQVLFLDPSEYVVPPTAVRCLPRAAYETLHRSAPKASFDGTDCVLGTFSYWLEPVDRLGRPDRRRLAVDDAYRRTLGNLNVLTFLISHRDTKNANFVITAPTYVARAFAVDNGMAFSGLHAAWGWLGNHWGRLMMTSLPVRTIERLRRIQASDLRRLEVLAQFEVRDGQLVPVPLGPPIARDQGVRRRGNVVQLGLTEAEIAGLWSRIQQLLDAVDHGRVELVGEARSVPLRLASAK